MLHPKTVQLCAKTAAHSRKGTRPSPTHPPASSDRDYTGTSDGEMFSWQPPLQPRHHALPPANRPLAAPSTSTLRALW